LGKEEVLIVAIDVLKKHGFELAGSKVVNRLVIAVQGRPKRGKTHFSLSAPGPIAVFDTDEGLEGVTTKFPGKVVHRMDVTLFADQDPSQKEFERVIEAWNDLLSSSSVKSIVSDSATDLYELARMAAFGKLESVRARNYGPVHAIFRRIYRSSLSGEKNVILIHKVKAAYVNDVKTNKFELSGFSETASWAQLIVEMFRPGDNFDYPDDFGLTVLDSRHKPELNGQVFVGPMASFPFLASQVLDGTAPSDWA